VSSAERRGDRHTLLFRDGVEGDTGGTGLDEVDDNDRDVCSRDWAAMLPVLACAAQPVCDFAREEKLLDI